LFLLLYVRRSLLRNRRPHSLLKNPISRCLLLSKLHLGRFYFTSMMLGPDVLMCSSLQSRLNFQIWRIFLNRGWLMQILPRIKLPWNFIFTYLLEASDCWFSSGSFPNTFKFIGRVWVSGSFRYQML
jgi:hypothetical protein